MVTENSADGWGAGRNLQSVLGPYTDTGCRFSSPPTFLAAADLAFCEVSHGCRGPVCLTDRLISYDVVAGHVAVMSSSFQVLSK